MFILALMALVLMFGAANLFLILVVGTFTAIMAIVGAVIGRKNTATGALVLLSAGAASTVGHVAVLDSELWTDTALATALMTSLIVGWWGYGLVISGRL